MDSTISGSTTISTAGGNKGRRRARTMDVHRAKGENQVCCGSNYKGWQGK